MAGFAVAASVIIAGGFAISFTKANVDGCGTADEGVTVSTVAAFATGSVVVMVASGSVIVGFCTVSTVAAFATGSVVAVSAPLATGGKTRTAETRTGKISCEKQNSPESHHGLSPQNHRA